jgi:flavin-dependent dehydrogenase
MRVLICGAGIAGLTLASCLERRGHDPIVVERAAHLRNEGYMIDFCGSCPRWFVPEDEPHRSLRDLVTRMSTWPGVAGLLRRRMAAESMLGCV